MYVCMYIYVFMYIYCMWIHIYLVRLVAPEKIAFDISRPPRLQARIYIYTYIYISIHPSIYLSVYIYILIWICILHEPELSPRTRADCS